MSDQIPSRHEHEPIFPAGSPASDDPAARSLADALRLSFRLLTAIMIFVVLAFLLTGLKTIEPNEVGIVTVFGRVVRTAQPGLTYNWPFPIGEIEEVLTSERKLIVENLWMHETERDKATPLAQRRSQGKGLRPGWDGAVLTGDRYLLHVKLGCSYRVADPVAFGKYAQDAYTARYPGAKDAQIIQPVDETIRSAVCSAAVRAAATQTTDGLLGREQGSFTREVRKLAEAALRDMATGLTIVRLELGASRWPLEANAAYLAAQSASSNADRLKSEARSKAEEVLRKAAGENYEKLVGVPWRIGEAGGQGAGGEQDTDRPNNLIGRYAAARDAGDSAQAERLLKQIDQVLLSATTGGEAAAMIAQARSYETNLVQSIQARVVEFEKLLPEYKQSPDFTIKRLWADARDEIFEAPSAEKWNLAMGRGKTKTIVVIGKDPDIVRKQTQEKLQADKEAREIKKQQQQ